MMNPDVQQRGFTVNKNLLLAFASNYQYVQISIQREEEEEGERGREKKTRMLFIGK